MVKCRCGKQATFNVSGETKAIFCVEHRLPNMVDVKNKKCETNGCYKQPIYNVRGETKARFCIEHRLPDMVNVLNKKCEADGCEKRPTYNVRGETKALFCVEHRLQNMVDVKHETCETNGCEKRPTYNVRGEQKGRFCAEHRLQGMVDVKNKKCEADGCEKQPTYNVRGETKTRFCDEHRLQGMVDVKNKKCESCEKQPTYNVRGQTKGRFCYEHRLTEMINVKNKTCETDGCEKQPNYGWLGKGTSRCGPHRQKGMITSPNRKCETCKELGTHEANGARYCEDHMLNGAENLGVDTCTSCGLDDILTNGKCGTCDPQLIHIHRHAKEIRAKDLFTAAGFTFVHDKILESKKCGMERPDFQFDCGTHFVYVEVDEHQHQSYACECEQGRMINLVHVRGMPVRWIRYNPDVYEPANGQRKIKLEQREKKLIEYTKWAMKNPPDTISSVLYLFYDEYDTKNQEWHKLI